MKLRWPLNAVYSCGIDRWQGHLDPSAGIGSRITCSRVSSKEQAETEIQRKVDEQMEQKQKSKEHSGRPRKSFKIQITEEHIQEAKKHRSDRCMIAQALRTGLGAESTAVTAGLIKFNLAGTRYICETPIEAALKLKDWDEGKGMEPFTIRLKPVGTKPAVLRGPLKKPRKKGYKLNTSKKSKRTVRRYHGLQVIERVVVVRDPG